MRRIRLKKVKKINPLKFIIILSFFLIISLILIFKYIGTNLADKIQSYATTQSKKITSLVISETINENTLKEFDTDKLFITTNSSDGSISSVDFNSKAINELLVLISKNAKYQLKKLENGDIDNLNIINDSFFNVSKDKLKNGVIYEVPTGIIFNNSLLENIGPKIPVKLSFVGDIVTNVNTDLQDYGINNAIIKIDIEVIITEKVILPYTEDELVVKTNIPIAIKLIQGKIPNYYFNDDNPSVSISADD